MHAWLQLFSASARPKKLQHFSGIRSKAILLLGNLECRIETEQTICAGRLPAASACRGRRPPACWKTKPILDCY